MDELIALLDQFEGIAQELASSALVEASNTVALIKNRVLNQRQDAQSASTGQYSKALVPKFYLYNKSTSQGAERRIRASKNPFLSYSDLREANNLQTQAKDYSFSGRMWAEVGVVSQSVTDSSIEVTIGGQTPYSSRLLKFHEERDGINLLAVSQSESAMLASAVNARWNNLLSVIIV